MTVSIAVPRLHHFVPMAWDRLFNVRSAVYGTRDTIPEYRKAPFPSNAMTFKFPDDNHPWRVQDILLVKADGTVLKNRVSQHKGADGFNDWPTDLFRYDLGNKTMVLHSSVADQGPLTVHWFDPRKSPRWNYGWNDLEMKRFLVQGAGYVDENLIPPQPKQVAIRFQGGYRCYLEIASLPRHGIVKLNDTLDGFLYRGKMAFKGKDSFNYRIYNSLGQESDAACIVVQNL